MTRRQKSLSYFGEIEGEERESRGRRGKKREEINPADCFRLQNYPSLVRSPVNAPTLYSQGTLCSAVTYVACF